jgi:hypothetical protein
MELQICKLVFIQFLYGCETWSLTFREEHRLRVFEILVFGRKRDEVPGEDRRLHMEELYAVHSPSTIWVVKRRQMK